jgi:hypothetical protein
LLDETPLFEEVFPSTLDGQPEYGTNQPIGGLAVQDYFGDPGSATYSIDLSMFRDDILAVIPEPGSFTLAWLGAVFLGLRRRQA